MRHGCETPHPQQDSSPRRCQKLAQRWSRNSIFGTAKQKAIQPSMTGCDWMYRPVPCKSPVDTVRHGCETPHPQQDSSPRRCPKLAQRWSRNSIFGTAKQKAIRGIQGIEGKVIDVSMDRPVPWKSPVEHWGMVAKHLIPSRIQAQGGARSVRRDGLEIASSELLNRRQYKAYKA